MPKKPEWMESDDGRIRKIAWTAGGLATIGAAGTIGVIYWERLRHRPAKTADEALAIFRSEDAEHHQPAIQIIDALIPDKDVSRCLSFDDLLRVTGYEGRNHKLTEIIDTLSEKRMGSDFAIIQTANNETCRLGNQRLKAHYEASPFALDAYDQGMFGNLLATYQVERNTNGSS